MASLSLKTGWNEWYRRRVPVVSALLVLGLAILLTRMLWLQVIRGQEYRRLSMDNRIRLQVLDPPRGRICDRNGLVLADTRPSFDVFAVPKDTLKAPRAIMLLARCLDKPVPEIRAKIEKAGKESPVLPALVEQDVGRDRLAVIESRLNGMPGVTVEVRSLRQYPEVTVAAHVVGYLGQPTEKEMKNPAGPKKRPGDYIGRSGTEYACEPFLAGRSGGRQVEVDALGRVVSVLDTVPPLAGKNVFLTLDARLQKKAESLLSGMEGAVVALDVQNGGVLAMASAPAFDPNLFVSGMSRRTWQALLSNPGRPLDNKALAGEYPPGSVYKIVTAMAGLEEGVVTPQTLSYCPGYYVFGSRPFRCWKKGGHGSVSLVQALTESCDVYFYRLGEKLGVDRIARYALASGFGRAPGLGMGREGAGLVPTSAWKKRRFGAPWMSGETLSVAIGQGYDLVTPLQAAGLLAAVANGGTLYAPRIVDRVEAPDRSVVQRFYPRGAGKLPVSRANLESVRQGLWGVVNDPRGTAYRSRSREFAVSGKTGTAQVVGQKEGGKSLSGGRLEKDQWDHAWFAGYHVMENGQGIAVAVLVENGGHGASTAAPLAVDLIREFVKIHAR